LPHFRQNSLRTSVAANRSFDSSVNGRRANRLSTRSDELSIKDLAMEANHKHSNGVSIIVVDENDSAPNQEEHKLQP
jgi:hypothetical protein